MTVKSKKDRIAAMIASLKRAAAGDYSKIIDISGKHDELDSLADAINKVLKKTDKLLSGQKQTESKLKPSEKRYKNILKALTESEQRYRMIVENVHDVVFTVDFNFQFTFISHHRTLLTGYTPEEIRKIPADKLVTAQSLEFVSNVFAKAMESRKNWQPNQANRSRTLELEAYHKNGGTVWLEITAAFSSDAHGKAQGIVAVARNITARKKIELALEESEKRYRMIVENIHEVVLTTDLNLHQIYVSPSCQWLIGYNQEEVMSLPIDRLLTPDSFTLAQNTLAEELTIEFSGEPIDPSRSRTIELEVHHKNGGTVWLEITATFIRDENGKPTGLLIAGRDINARKKAEEEKVKLEEQLLQAQKMESVGRLAGGVAHDFNNMLNVILGYVELSKPKLTPGDPVLKDIEEIEKAASRSRDITSQLLAFSRKQIISPKIINLNELILSIQKTLARVIGEDVHLSFYPKENLWQIKFDPTHIEQILFNLAANARDAMPGGGKLTMETNNVHLDEAFCRDHLDFMPGDYVVLTVSDSGSGINKENLQYVFEPFFTTKDVGKGTGLGLAMVYGIVKQNGGFINVYSEPGQGTTFKIYMTRNLEMDATVEETKEETTVFSPAMILLVEDDDMVRGMITQMLKAIGYSVMAAATPGEALSLCEKGDTTVDLVITDVVMPVMNGRELRDKLRVVRPEIKVLFVSGYTSNVVVHHGILEEGVHFLQKPFSMNDLSRKISEALAGKRSY
jgi:PAS domain S-box-containing protein